MTLKAAELLAAHDPTIEGCDWALDFGDPNHIRILAQRVPNNMLAAAVANSRHGAYLLRTVKPWRDDPARWHPIVSAALQGGDPDLLIEFADILPSEVPALQREYCNRFRKSPELQRRLSNSLEFLRQVPTADPARHLDLFKDLKAEDQILALVTMTRLEPVPGHNHSREPVPVLKDEALMVDALRWLHLNAKSGLALLNAFKANHIRMDMLEKAVLDHLPPPEATENTIALKRILPFARQFKQWMSPDGVRKMSDLALLVGASNPERRELCQLYPDSEAADDLIVTEIMER